jgi:hypothetical protein
MVVDRVALDAGALGDCADRRSGRADLAVKLECRRRDPLPRLVQRVLAATHPVGSTIAWILLRNHVQRKY